MSHPLQHPCQRHTGHYWKNSSEGSNSPTVSLSPLKRPTRAPRKFTFGFPVVVFRNSRRNPAEPHSFGSYAHAGKQCGCLSGGGHLCFRSFGRVSRRLLNWLVSFLPTCPKAMLRRRARGFQFPENVNGGTFATTCFNYE